MNIVHETDINQQWIVTSVDVQTNDNNGVTFNEVVKRVYYKVVSTFEDYEFSETGMCILDELDPNHFIEFDNLNNDIVVEWVKDMLGEQIVRGYLVNGAKNITIQKYPSYTNKVLT